MSDEARAVILANERVMVGPRRRGAARGPSVEGWGEMREVGRVPCG